MNTRGDPTGQAKVNMQYCLEFVSKAIKEYEKLLNTRLQKRGLWYYQLKHGCVVLHSEKKNLRKRSSNLIAMCPTHWCVRVRALVRYKKRVS